MSDCFKNNDINIDEPDFKNAFIKINQTVNRFIREYLSSSALHDHENIRQQKLKNKR